MGRERKMRRLSSLSERRISLSLLRPVMIQTEFHVAADLGYLRAIVTIIYGCADVRNDLDCGRIRNNNFEIWQTKYKQAEFYLILNKKRAT